MKNKVKSFSLLWLFFVLFVFAAGVAAQPKDLRLLRDDKQSDGFVGVALVVGNSDYKYTTRLKSPVNDAQDMAKTLSGLGFKVLKVRSDASLAEMDDAVAEFGRELAVNKGVGVFYYSGHGVQSDGKNYLIPVDANIPLESFLKSRSFDTDVVLETMAKVTKGFKIVILDACRNNPFAKSWGYKGGSGADGLAGIYSAPRGMIIAYATSPNDTAADGTGRNSPYTEVLLQEIIKPDLRIGEMFNNVREILDNRTNGDQTPWESTSLIGRFCFAGCKIQNTPSPGNTAESNSSGRDSNTIRPQQKPSPVSIVSNTPVSIVSNPNAAQPNIKPEAKTLAEQALNEAMNYNWKGANQLAGEALATDSNLPLALAISGWMKFKDDWEAKALKEGRSKMEKSVQLEPDNALLVVLLAKHAKLGRVYKKNTITSDPADKQLAGKLAAQVLTFKPKTGIDYYAQAIARKIIADDNYNTNDKNKIRAAAIADLTRAIELNPQYSIIYQERAATYYELKKYEEAIADYTTFIEMKPNIDLGYYERGNVYKERSGDYDKAIEDFNKAIEISPNKSRHFQGRGKVYFNKGDFNQAIADFTKAIQLLPQHYVYYFERAAVYEKIGRMDLAQADRKKAIKLQD